MLNVSCVGWFRWGNFPLIDLDSVLGCIFCLHPDHAIDYRTLIMAWYNRVYSILWSLQRKICRPIIFRSSAFRQVQTSNDSMLRLFLEFPVSVLHHPVHEILSMPSSSSLPLFPSILLSTISLCRELHLRKCPTQFFCLVGLYMKVYLYAWGKRDYCSEPAVATVGRDVCADLGRYIHIVLLIEFFSRSSWHVKFLSRYIAPSFLVYTLLKLIDRRQRVLHFIH